MTRRCGDRRCSWCLPRKKWSRRTERLAVTREVESDLTLVCHHRIQVRRGSLLSCMVCGDLLDALTGRTATMESHEETHMRIKRTIVSRPTLGQRAAAPVTTSQLLAWLGYREVSETEVDIYRMEQRSVMPRFRRSGGKGGGYCPVTD